MCGFTGFISKPNINGTDILKKTTNLIKHRGPDSSGFYVNKNDGIYLGHRRLSILELTEKGSQPMTDNLKNYILLYNGEIYNHLELRKDLPNVIWNSQSDTETLLNYIIYLGVDKALDKIEGMFAFVFIDQLKKKIFLAKDRFGEKPLYYGSQSKFFFFSSELKCINENPYFNKVIDQSVLGSYLNLNYIPSPYSIYKDIYKLESGTYKIFKYDYGFVKEIFTKKYWSINNSKISKINQINNDNINNVEFLIEKSVKKQLLSDVPIGSFLSGGIDSTLISYYMQKNAMNKINTFSIGFENNEFDESIYAKEISNFIGTNHTSEILTARDSLKIISSISEVYDEPFADSSQIPTIFLSRITSKNIKVALTGDGGDEIFGGYNRYLIAKNIFKYLKYVPLKARNLISKLLLKLNSSQWDKIANQLNFLTPSSIDFNQKGEKIVKFAEMLKSNSDIDMYMSLISNWQWTSNLLKNSNDVNLINIKNDEISNMNFLSQMMSLDSTNYLTDDILVKVDRASMYSSLETRVPFLDKELVEFTNQLGENYFINKSTSKWILKEILNRNIPKKYFERPKMGFGIPLGDWLQNDLKEWTMTYLSKEMLNRHGFFNEKKIAILLNNHMTRKQNNQYKLWNLLMFQNWYAENF